MPVFHSEVVPRHGFPSLPVIMPSDQACLWLAARRPTASRTHQAVVARGGGVYVYRKVGADLRELGERRGTHRTYQLIRAEGLSQTGAHHRLRKHIVALQ